MILDAQTLLDYFDRDASGHWAAAGAIEARAEVEQLVVSPFVIAELEGLVLERFGGEAWVLALEQLASGAWTIAPVDAAHLLEVRGRVAAGQTLAGASVAVLVEGDS